MRPRTLLILQTLSKNVGPPRIKSPSSVVLNHIRPIQRFLEIRSTSLTFLERSSRFLRCSRCVHADVTSSVPVGAPRASGFLDLSARTSLLLCLLAAFPFHSAILKPDLHLQSKVHRVIIRGGWTARKFQISRGEEQLKK